MEGVFKVGASAAASKFCEWCQVRIEVYIPHRKYQVKPHLSPWFSAACAATIVHRNLFFCLYQKDKSSDSMVKFRQTSNRCKRVLVAARLAYLIKQNTLLLPRNLAVVTFGELLIVSSTKVNLLYLLYSTAQRCCLLHLIKQKLYAENFSKNSNLEDSGISLPIFLSTTNLKLQNIFVTPKMVKKVIMNLDLSKAYGPDCIPVVVLKNCETELSYISAELFSKCLKESCFPGCFISGHCI